MIHIKKIINLSDYKSLIPSVVNCYLSNGKTVNGSDFVEIKYNDKNSDIQNNYAQFPSHSTLNDDNVYCWKSLMKIYHFYKEYYKILNFAEDCLCKDEYESFNPCNFGSGNTTYSSATEYSIHKLGYESEEYVNLDNQFAEYLKIISPSDLFTYLFCDKDNVRKVITESDKLSDLDKYAYERLSGKTSNDEKYFTCISFPLQLTNSVENLGMETVYDDPWDYTINYPQSPSGTVITYDFNTYHRTTSRSSTTYTPEFNEYTFGNLEWDNNAKEYVEKDKDKPWEKRIEDRTLTSEFTALTRPISGYTDSKLSCFSKNRILVDNLGFILKGYLQQASDEENNQESNQGIIQPNENDILNPLYSVGDVCDLELIDESKNLYKGSIITEIKYSVPNYKGYNGKGDIERNLYTSSIDDNVVEEIGNLVSGQTEVSYPQCLYNLDFDLQCAIIYHMGCDIIKNDSGYTLAPSTTSYTSYQGVKYEETYRLTTKENTYIKGIGNEYSVYTFEYEPISQTMFTLVKPFVFTNINNNISTSFNDFPTMDKYNDFNLAPTLRQSYHLGTASHENIVGSIYVDRGISSMYEKWLKIQETDTLEDLEFYGNGFFTIRNDKEMSSI